MLNEKKKPGCSAGCGFSLALAILIFIASNCGHKSIAVLLALILFVTLFVLKIRLICSYKPDSSEAVGPNLENKDSSRTEVENVPEFEIKYRKTKDAETVRKISVVKIGEFLSAYCFLKKSICTFSFSKIVECVDLSTGEIVKEDFRTYYAKSRLNSFKPIDIFDFYYWEPVRYSSFMDLPAEMSGFELNEKLVMDVVTFKYGERKEEFVCKRIIEKKNDADRFCVELVDSSNKKLFVGMSKIISVDGIEDFGEYLIEKFYESRADKNKLT